MSLLLSGVERATSVTSERHLDMHLFWSFFYFSSQWGFLSPSLSIFKALIISHLQMI